MTLTLRVAIATHLVLGLALCFVPLFSGLGFERALATGLLAAITSPLVTISLCHFARQIGPQGLPRVAQRALIINALTLVPSTAAGAVMELVRQSCEPNSGLLFIALIAGGNVVFGTALGGAAALLRRRWMANASVLIVLVLALVGVVARFYTDPQIFIYSAPWGYWPGSIYDEALAVDVRLWSFRGYTVLLAGAIYAVAVAFSNEQIRPQARPQVAILLSGVLLAILTLWALRAGRDIGWNLDRNAVQESLRTRVETDHFIIHVDPSVSPERLRRIVEDHEHRYRQLTTFFKTEPDGKIVSFIYRNRAQKARLMGAQRTQIARPWNREVHIDGFRVPHPVLKHELAHVFAGKLATGPFKVPAVAGIFVNIGVVEGIAVAADWRVRELTVHGWTKAMQGLGLMPDLRKSLDVFGFWSISSSRAYTVAGSFFRYLVDKYGIEKFGVLYATNDFTAAYEQSLDALVTEWEAFLKGIPLPQDDLLVAEHRFKRPSIFQKVCPHVAANISSRGYARLHSGDLEGAQADLEQIYGYAPANPTPLIALAEGFARAERFEEAQVFVERALEAPDATLKGKTQAIEARANLAWREDRTEDAVKDYAVVKKRHLSTPSDRLQQARIMALTRTSTAVTDLMRDVLLSDQKPQRGLARLAEASVTIRNVPLVHYLYARALERAGAYPEAVEAAARAVELDIGGDPLKTEAILTYGRLLWWDGKAHEAAVVFDAIAQNHASPAMTAAAADWADRARFTAAKTSTRSPSLIE